MEAVFSSQRVLGLTTHMFQETSIVARSSVAQTKVVLMCFATTGQSVLWGDRQASIITDER
jgi:hypothetical protein